MGEQLLPQKRRGGGKQREIDGTNFSQGNGDTIELNQIECVPARWSFISLSISS